MNWFTQLGGKRHRSFIAFCLVMVGLVLFAVFIWPAPGRAGARLATTGTWYGPYSMRNASGIGTPWYQQTVWWCGERDAGRNFCADVSNPLRVKQEYGENALWSYSKTFMVKDAGRTTSPSGNPNTAWKMVWGAVEFKSCQAGICAHTYPYGVRMYVWANGEKSRVRTSVAPFKPAPRP